MAVTYQNVITSARRVLQDEEVTYRWPDDELLTYVREGEHEVVRLKPDVYPVIESQQLSAGSAQQLSSGSIQLLDVLCNMGSGATRGNIVRLVERKILDALIPGWMSETASDVVKHVVYDSKRAPKLFWVYPKSPGTNYLELMVSKLPQNSSKAVGDAILIPEEYATSLKHYVVSTAFSKDLDIPGSLDLFTTHRDMFIQSLLLRDARELSINPKRNRELD